MLQPALCRAWPPQSAAAVAVAAVAVPLQHAVVAVVAAVDGARRDHSAVVAAQAPQPQPAVAGVRDSGAGPGLCTIQN